MRRKLLLADDSITVQRVIELTFSDEGLDIVTVGDGAQAIARLQQDRPDIVLADLNMPGADGYAVAEHVKRGSDLVEHTRVVLLTGAFEPVDQDRARGLGVDGVLAKPFEPHVAIELVRQLLDQAPLAPPRGEGESDWTAGVPAPAAAGSNWGEDAGAAPVTAVAAGYPFEPGTATARSTPAELDDYFKRLDEALTNAGLTASPAVRDMLAETQTIQGGGGARMHERAAAVGSTVDEDKRQMSGTPSTGPTNVTLVDAFSALLAAEQVSGPTGGTNLEFWARSSAPTSEAPAESSRVEVVVENASPAEDASSDATTFEATSDAAAADVADEQAADSSAAFSEASGADDHDEVSTFVESSFTDETSPVSANTYSARAVSAGVSSADTVSAGAVSAGAASSSMTSASAASASMLSASAAVADDDRAVEAAVAHAGGPAEVHTVPESEAAAASAAPAVAAPPSIDAAQIEAQIEVIVRRVVEEMSDRIVREIIQVKVLDVAERLVREEIERIKASAADEA